MQRILVENAEVFSYNYGREKQRRIFNGEGIIGAAGYDGLLAVQTAEVVSAINMVYLVLPIPFLISIPVFYKLDPIYPTVMKELEEQENK